MSAPSPLAPDGCLLSSCFFHRWSHCQPLGWGGCLGRSSARHHGWLTEVTCPVQQLPHHRVRDKSCRKADLPSDVLPGIQLLPCSARRTGCSARQWHGHVQPGLCWGGKRRVESVQHGCILARRGKNYVTKAFVLCFRRKLPPAQLYTTARMKFGEREWQPRRRRQKRHLSCRGSNAGIPSVRQGAQGPSPWHPPCLSSRATQFCLCNWDSPSARCWKSQCHQTWGSTPG